MKRLIAFLVIMILIGGRKTFSDTTTVVTMKDSLLKVLDTAPADTTRLIALTSLIYLEDPMSSASLPYMEKLEEEAIRQDNKKYLCYALYVRVIYYFNHQNGKQLKLYMDRLADLALKYKYYDLYFTAKRADITMNIIERKIEYSITEAEDMYTLARKLNNVRGMSAAKLCLMNAYMMSARFNEGVEAGFEAYRLLPPSTSIETRKEILQEVTLACSSIKNKHSLEYIQEYEAILNKWAVTNQKFQTSRNSYLLLSTLYARYYLDNNNIAEARKYLKEMDKYFSPTSYIPYRGLYFDVYSSYYRLNHKFDKALCCADSAISLLSNLSENGGLNYSIKRAGILADAGRLEEAIPLFREMLAKKDSFYITLSASQMEEIHQMRNMDNLLLEKEQNQAMIHYSIMALIAIALIILTPSTIRIYSVGKRLKKEEEEIREMSLIAEEANEVKSRFLANMSYNIRIPLNNVLGFSELMTKEANNIDVSQWKYYSDIIQSNSAELIQLVNDVLDLSRLEAGKTKWQMQDHDIIPLCADCICMVEMRCGDKIKVNYQTDIESQPFQVDIARFTQLIVSTLIYTDPCEVKRTVSFSLNRDLQKQLLVFHIANSPLADPELQTQKVEIRHNINRLTIEYFGGTYIVEPDAPEGPTICFTYPYSEIK